MSDMAAGIAYPSGHLVPSHFGGLVYAPIVKTSFLRPAVISRTFHFEYPWVLSQIYSVQKSKEAM